MLLKITSNVAPLKLMDRFSGQRSFLRDACVSYWASAGTAKKRSRFQNFTFKRIHIGLICLFSFILLLFFFFPLKRLNIGMRGRVSRDPPGALPPCHGLRLHLTVLGSCPPPPGRRGRAEHWLPKNTATFAIPKAKVSAAWKVHKYV